MAKIIFGVNAIYGHALSEYWVRFELAVTGVGVKRFVVKLDNYFLSVAFEVRVKCFFFHFAIIICSTNVYIQVKN